MALTYTITFPSETLESGDSWQLILLFNSTETGSNVAINAEDQNILIVDHGETKWEYDYEGRLLMPGSSSLVIADINGYIHTLLFDSSKTLVTKRFYATINFKGAEEFSGYVDEDTLDYNMGTKLLSFTVSPKMDLLKNTPLYNESSVATYPVGGTADAYINLHAMILDIYEMIGATSLEWNDDTVYTDEDGGTWDADDLEMQYKQFFANSTVPLNDLTEVIKNLCIAFNWRSGMMNSKVAFVDKIRYYSTVTTQTIVPKIHVKSFQYSSLQWSKLSYNDPFKSATGSFNYGTFTNLADAKIEETVIPWGIAALSTKTGNVFVNNSGYKTVTDAYVPGTWMFGLWGLTSFAAMALVVNRNSIENQTVHEFKMNGCDYSLRTTVLYGGGYYYIISMTKDWEKEETTMKCLYCAAVS
jgi:hypothetical protein